MVHTPKGSVLYVCTKFEADSSIRSKVIRGSQNFEIGLRDPDNAHLGSHFMVHMQEGSVLYVPTKFEVDSSIHSKFIRGPKIWNLDHVTLSHAPFEP